MHVLPPTVSFIYSTIILNILMQNGKGYVKIIVRSWKGEGHTVYFANNVIYRMLPFPLHLYDLTHDPERNFCQWQCDHVKADTIMQCAPVILVLVLLTFE